MTRLRLLVGRRSGAGLCIVAGFCLAVGVAWGQANPVFAPGGPDAALYGADRNYPYGPPNGEPIQTFMVGTLTHFDRIFPRHVVAHGDPMPLPRAPEELALSFRHGGTMLSLDDYITRNPTTSLLIARRGKILYEHYQYGRTDKDRFLSFSMAKTVTGMLIGIAVRDGAIRSIDQPASDYAPELSGTEYGATSIRDLLRMASGVAFRETYDGDDDATRLRIMQYRTGGPRSADIVASFNTREAAPGTRFHYASAESAVLGLVLRHAVSMPLADYLSARLWRPMGAEADATWGVDNSSQETTQCCLSAVARDWLRLGILLANDGTRDGREIIPRAWVLEATTPSATFAAPGVATPIFGYGYQTWLLPGPRRQFALRGVHGQIILVDPAAKLVLVHTSVRLQAARDPGLPTLLSLWAALVAMD